MKIFLLHFIMIVSSISFAGGVIDGGGGGTTPTNPSEVGHVINAIHEAKTLLRLSLRKFQHDIFWGLAHFENFNSPLGKYFEGPRNLLTVLEQTEIEAPTNRPCYDANQVEVDGSIYASSPQTICISAFRIAPKVDQSRLHIEVLALIAHELSHLLGADEGEAVMIQQIAINSFSGFGIGGAFQYLSESKMGFQEFVMDAENFRNWMSADEMAYLLETLFNEFSIKDPSGPYYLFAKTESDKYEMIKAKLELSLWFARGQSSMRGSLRWREAFDNVFKGKDSVKFSETFYAGDFPNSEYGDEVIHRLTSLNQIGEILSLAKTFAFDMSSRYLYPLLDASPLLPLHDLYGKSPWTHFLGSYRVAATHCEQSGVNPALIQDVKRFTVSYAYPEISSVLGLNAETADGIVRYSVDSDSSYDDLVFGTVTVSNDQTAVFRELESGTQWAAKWRKSSHELRKNGTELTMIRRIFNQEWSESVPTRSTSVCTYKLVQE